MQPVSWKYQKRNSDQPESENVEWIPPLKELLEGNSGYQVSVFLKVLVQYALRGYANSWNMESCEMLDTLNEVKQFVDLSVTADSDLIRYQATNQILLKMWKYFGIFWKN